MKPSLISCIVPVFNGERYLREALDSILAQTYRPLEIMVVDDGSTDGTAAVVTGYGEQVRYLRQLNAGPATARNTGVSAAKGEFIAFLDSDDLWHPKKLHLQMARFEARPELGVCVTHIENFWMQDLKGEEERFRGHRRGQALPGYSTVTLLARRDLFHTIGLFKTALKHGDDTDWFLRVQDHGAVTELLPEVLVYRRLHSSSRSRLWASRSRDEYLLIVKSLLDRRRSQEK